MIRNALDFLNVNPRACLFPIAPNRKMPPLIKRNLTEASTDRAQLEFWAANGKVAIGVAR